MPENLILDNDQGNQDQGSGATTTQAENTAVTAATVEGGWKGKLGTDLGKAPFLEKFEDTPEGMSKAFESHYNLEKLLGHDKVPIPKGPDDKEGWARYSKAMGIPDKATEYGLPDAAVPESMKGIAFDKQKFAETVHAYKLTPTQAKGLWEQYTKMTNQAYNTALEGHQKKMTETINQLRGEWGDAYETNVELGQMVINKFSENKEEEDFITAALVSDPRGIKFLTKLGNQFAENKMGEFQYKRFAQTPEQIESEINSIRKDMNHPYNNEKSTPKERQAAIDYVNSLTAKLLQAKG